MIDGWMLPPEVFHWLDEHIVQGSSILEFGSGVGSIELSKKYQLISIEHDSKWIGLSSGTYIHAEIIQNQVSNKYSEVGWYDIEKLQNLPSYVDLILIDGPPGDIGRSGILHFLNELPECTWIIIDDTDRLKEKNLAEQIIERLTPTDIFVIKGQIPRYDGNMREATIIRVGE